MTEVFKAYGRALRSLLQPAILWHLVWPTLLAVVFWGVVAWLSWDSVGAVIERLFAEVTWLNWIMQRWEASALAAAIFVKIVLGLLLLPLVYGTALFIVAVFALPLMLERVSAADYADVEKRHGGSIFGSVWNALVALVVFLVGWIVTLPLWLVPGMAMALPLLLSAYLNQRAFRYDALAAHADPRELRAVIAGERGQLYLVGIVAGLLAYVPLVNLVAPAYAGLAFIHYCLAALRRERGKAISTPLPPGGEG
jgi:CysZ protein